MAAPATLPDRAPLRYNYVGAVSQDGITYLGAQLAGDDPAEIVMIPIAGTIHTENDNPGLQVQVQNSGHLSLVTVFLTGEWVGADVGILENRLVMYGLQQIELPIP